MKKKLTLLLVATSFLAILFLPVLPSNPSHFVILNDQVGGA
ncbi:hypothetical protein [Paenibacillus sp. FSL M7-1046]